MSNYELNNSHELPKTEADKYTGMRNLNFAITPNVLLCGLGGAVLGVILSLWATSEVGIVGASALVLGILSGIFGMFL